MKYNEEVTSRFNRLITAFVLVAFLSAGALGQDGTGTKATDAFSGRYEGTAKTEGAADLQVTFDLKNEAGKVSGNARSGETTLAISEGTLADGKLTLKFAGRDGVLTAKVEGDKIKGEWIQGAQKRLLELKKVAAPAVAPVVAPTASAFTLQGDWDGVADAQGEPFPFVLNLKVDGEKVTGSSSSQLGESTITNGLWKDGRLTFQLEGAGGTISMSATVLDGKLTGEFDYAGQMQGKWVAVKKN